MARSNNVTGVERISDLVAVVGVVAPDPYTDSVRSRMGSTAARMGTTTALGSFAGAGGAARGERACNVPNPRGDDTQGGRPRGEQRMQ